MLIHNEIKTVASTDAGWNVGGDTWTGNTAHRIHGNLLEVYIASTTAGTTYKFKLTDIDGHVIFDTEDYWKGTQRQINLHVPVKGTYEMSLYNVSLKEEFKILLGVREA